MQFFCSFNVLAWLYFTFHVFSEWKNDKHSSCSQKILNKNKKWKQQWIKVVHSWTPEKLSGRPVKYWRWYLTSESWCPLRQPGNSLDFYRHTPIFTSIFTIDAPTRKSRDKVHIFVRHKQRLVFHPIDRLSSE